jgi:hypothetical protein
MHSYSLKLTVTFRSLPDVGVFYVAKVLHNHIISTSVRHDAACTYRCQTPIRIIRADQALQINFLVELIRLLDFTCLVCAAVAVRILFANSNVDQILCIHLFGRRKWFGSSIALVDVRRAVLVVVVHEFKRVSYWPAVVEVCDVGFRVQVLLRDVAVVGGFHPVPNLHQYMCSREVDELTGHR